MFSSLHHDRARVGSRRTEGLLKCEASGHKTPTFQLYQRGLSMGVGHRPLNDTSSSSTYARALASQLLGWAEGSAKNDTTTIVPKSFGIIFTSCAADSLVLPTGDFADRKVHSES